MIKNGLKDKVAIITGANNPYGIGAGIARALAGEGVRVFLHGFRHERKGNRQDERVATSATTGQFKPGKAFYDRQSQTPLEEVLRSMC